MSKYFFQFVFNVCEDFKHYVIYIKNLSLDDILNITEEKSNKILKDYLKQKD